MANKIELKRYIRFQLEQLSPLNAPHPFELLCFEIAKRRIASNVVPATGPVQAGGDQGRDFESFRTYLTGTELTGSLFLANLRREMVVFACTLDKKTEQKIKGDLKVIFGGGNKPDAVYYFCVPDLPVAKRHELQVICQSEYDAKLEILDGQAISDILSDGDCFWLAQQFLSVPAELFPRVEADEEYDELRERWLVRQDTIETLADYLEVKRGLRRATFEQEVNSDLDAWTRQIRTAEHLPPYHRQILYEVAVANLRGRGSLDSVLSEVREFFATLPEIPNEDELEDAFNLSSYASTAVKIDQLHTDPEEVENWRKQVFLRIDEALARPQRGSTRFDLLVRSGQGAVWDIVAGAAGSPNIAVSKWLQALEISTSDPLCQVGQLAKLIELLTPFIGDCERYDELTARLDRIVSSKEGAAAAAESARKRGIAFFENGQTLRAIDQIQRAKVGWLSAETGEGAVIATLLLANWYLDLRLPLAARYYAMAGARLAIDLKDPGAMRHVVMGGFLVADSYYDNGEAFSFLGVVNSFLPTHMQCMPDPGNPDRHSHISRALNLVATVYGVVPKLYPGIATDVETWVDALPVDSETLAEIKQIGAEEWATSSPTDITKKLADELGHGMACDLREVTLHSWKALGIQWTISGDRKLQSYVDQAAALMQILQVDLADLDLLVIPSNVEIRVSGTSTKAKARQLPDNGKLIWDVVFSTNAESKDYDRDETIEVFSLVTAILGQTTGLNREDFNAKLEQRFSRGLMERIFWVQPAMDLLAEARRIVSGPEDVRLPALPGDSEPIVPVGARQLEGVSGPASIYTFEKSKKFIGNRYDALLQAVRGAVTALKKDRQAWEKLQGLHEEGMPDWRIILILYNISLNKMMNINLLAGPSLSRAQFQSMITAAHQKLLAQGVRNLAPSDLLGDALQRVREVTVSNVSATWGLVNHRDTPDFGAIEQLLLKRFNLHVDDVPHEDIFGWKS